MNTKTLKAYLKDCEKYGWVPNFKGAKAYQIQVRSGLREKWSAR